MKSMTRHLLESCAVLVLLGAAAGNAHGQNVADYTLRINIFTRDAIAFDSTLMVEEPKGEGRGNLFEGADVHGVDFTFACGQKFKTPYGYTTYAARWKTPGKQLTVLLPVFGQPKTFFACDFSTDVKDFVYTPHKGKMGPEPEAKFKAWMAKYDYDPVHGIDSPTEPERGDAESLLDNQAPAKTKFPPPPSDATQ